MTGTELRKVRRALKLSQQKLAQELSLPVQMIADWERGGKPVPANMEATIRATLGRLQKEQSRHLGVRKLDDSGRILYDSKEPS